MYELSNLRRYMIDAKGQQSISHEHISFSFSITLFRHLSSFKNRLFCGI